MVNNEDFGELKTSLMLYVIPGFLYFMPGPLKFLKSFRDAFKSHNQWASIQDEKYLQNLNQWIAGLFFSI